MHLLWFHLEEHVPRVIFNNDSFLPIYTSSIYVQVFQKVWFHKDEISVVQTSGIQMVLHLDCRVAGEPVIIQILQFDPEFSLPYAALRCLDDHFPMSAFSSLNKHLA